MLWYLAAVQLAAAPLADGQRLFDAGDFDGALKKLDAGLKAEPAPPERAQLQLMRGRCLSALRRNAEIEAAMEAALEADPTLMLDEAGDSPGFRATFERVRARLAATVTIETEPAGAAVRIDGALVGPSPVKQLLPVGRYRLGVLDEAGHEVSRELLVAARTPQTVTVTLARATPAAPAPEPQVTAAEPARGPWPIELGVTGRALTDFRGAAVELGVAVLGRYFVVEASAVLGDSAGVSLRAGGRLPFVRGLFALQLTADAVAFFRPTFAPGGGATAGFSVHPVSFLDLVLEGSARFFAAAPRYRAQYFLGALALRLRWPTGLDGAP